MKKNLSIIALALASITAQADELSEIFNNAANLMYPPYMQYFNGVSAMQTYEQECWRQAAKPENAEYCAVLAFTGTIIEAAHAREEARQPALAYNAYETKDRVVARLKEKGFSDVEINEVLSIILENTDKIIIGLTNAGSGNFPGALVR